MIENHEFFLRFLCLDVSPDRELRRGLYCLDIPLMMFRECGLHTRPSGENL